MAKKYEVLLFDLDDTLVDDIESKKYGITKVLQSLGKEEKVIEFTQLDHRFWSDRAAGKIPDPYIFKTKEEQTIWIRDKRFMLFFKDMDLNEAIKCNEIYTEAMQEKVVAM